MTATEAKPMPKSITIVGRRWFKRGPGNTYHSAEILVDGVLVHKIEYAYGYDRQFEYNATVWLDQNGYTPGRETHPGTPGESIWRFCERNNIAYHCTVTDVNNKKDL